MRLWRLIQLHHSPRIHQSISPSIFNHQLTQQTLLIASLMAWLPCLSWLEDSPELGVSDKNREPENPENLSNLQSKKDSMYQLHPHLSNQYYQLHQWHNPPLLQADSSTPALTTLMAITPNLNCSNNNSRCTEDLMPGMKSCKPLIFKLC